jgi:hypothetical protein
MMYESEPAFIKLFKFSLEIAKVDRSCVCFNSIYYFVQWGPTDDGNKQHQDVDNKQNNPKQNTYTVARLYTFLLSSDHDFNKLLHTSDQLKI